MNTDFTRGLQSARGWFLLTGVFIGMGLLSSCDSDDSSVDCSVVNITVNASVDNADCPEANGSITIAANGGGGNFEYSIDGTNFQESNVFANLESGNYTVTARDGDGCSAEAEAVVESISDVNFTTVSNVAAGCGGNDGSLTVIASGGDGSYRYSIDDSGFQASNQFDNLSNGLHTVTVIDGNDCQTSGEGYVISGISFSGQVSAIITTYCAVSGCHVAGEQQPDLTVFANIQSSASEIRSRTQSRNMPRGSTLTDEQIAAIACWVDDGALNN